MRKCELIWLAGLLEGEGSFGFQSTPIVQVNMTDRDIIERVSLLFDGSHIMTLPARTSKHQTQWRTYVSGAKALSIIRQVLPFMGQRRTARIIEIMNLANSRPGHAKGEMVDGAKLRAEWIPFIRELARRGISHQYLATICRVARTSITHVVNRKTWKHIT